MMIYWICGILTAAILALATHIFYLRRQINHLAVYLKQCDLADDIRQIAIPLRDKKLEELAAQINRIFNQHNASLVATRRKNKELKEFISEVSHDMRTPLTAVIGYLEILHHAEPEDNEQKRKTEAALNRACALHELLDNFFILSLTDNDAYEVDMEQLDLTNLVSEVLLHNYDALSARSIAPHFSTDEPHVFILGDLRMMERVIQNLISNCLRYSVGDIDIVLEEKTVPIMVVKNPVENIKKLDIGRLFERFYSPDKARSSGSVGLGLAIVERFLDLMGASITASTSGSYLIFTIEFQSLKRGNVS